MNEISRIDLDLLYDELLISYQKQKVKNRWSTKNKIYISTLVSSKCDRQLRFIFDDANIDDNLNIWPGIENEIGTIIHEKIQESFLNNNLLKEIEKKIPVYICDNVTINIKIDGIFNNGNLLEIKTLGPKYYGIKFPREKDVMQINFYLGITKSEYGILSYLKRDNGKHITSFKIKFNEENFKKLLSRICKIINNNDLHVDKNSCKFCQFTNACKEINIK